MATLDIVRALAMLPAIRADRLRATTRRFIARYLLLSTAERDRLPVAVSDLECGCRGSCSNGENENRAFSYSQIEDSAVV